MWLSTLIFLLEIFNPMSASAVAPWHTSLSDNFALFQSKKSMGNTLILMNLQWINLIQTTIQHSAPNPYSPTRLFKEHIHSRVMMIYSICDGLNINTEQNLHQMFWVSWHAWTVIGIKLGHSVLRNDLPTFLVVYKKIKSI